MNNMFNVSEKILNNEEKNYNLRANEGIIKEKLTTNELQKLLYKIFEVLKVKYKKIDETVDDIEINLQGTGTDYILKAKEVEDFVDVEESLNTIVHDFQSLKNYEEKENFIRKFTNFNEETYKKYFQKIIPEYKKEVEKFKEEAINFYTLKRDIVFHKYKGDEYNIEIKNYSKKMKDYDEILYSEPFSSYSKRGTKRLTYLDNFFLNLFRIYIFYKVFANKKKIVPDEKISLLENRQKHNLILLNTPSGLFFLKDYDILATIKTSYYHITLENLENTINELPRFSLYFTFSEKNIQSLENFFIELFPSYTEKISEVCNQFIKNKE